MKEIVFLFVFVFSPVAIITGSHGKSERDKLMEKVEEKVSTTPKTVEGKVLEAFSSWHTASASYYNSNDSSQTREDCDGVGAFGHLIKSGSIALGSSYTETFRNEGMKVFIQIKGFNTMTPYGKGIFRVDDVMHERFNKGNRYYIDFFHKDLSLKYKLLGRFRVKFKIVRIN
jgi:hypothetical protein